MKNLTKEEKIIVNTGLGLMVQMMEAHEPVFLKYLIGHPYKGLITLESIHKLSKKFKINGELEQ